MAQFDVGFTDGARVSVRSGSGGPYDVSFIDSSSGYHIYDTSIPNGCWAAANPKYYVPWNIVLSERGKEIVAYQLELKNKNVFIQFHSNALGDTVAWMPYCEEFRKKHGCNLFVESAWNELFEAGYPEIKFVRKVSPETFFATYYMGVWNDYNRNRNNWRLIPLQQVASDILGLQYSEIRPRLCVGETGVDPVGKPYVAITEFSTFRGKLWNYKNGWEDVVEYLHAHGLAVMSVSKEPTRLKNVIAANDRPIQETINNIRHAKFFIGPASGLAWIAWALHVPTVIISGFTKPFSEMTDCIRIINEKKCNGCYNDLAFTFDKCNYGFCPRNKGYECTTSITSDMVKNALSELVGESRLVISGKYVNVRADKYGKSDRYVAKHVFEDDEYQLESLGINPRLILDIGGHIGSFGLKAKCLWPAAEVIAAEPYEVTASLYRKNIQDNNLENIEVYNTAIGYDPERKYLAEDINCSDGGIMIKKDEITPEGRIIMPRLNPAARYRIEGECEIQTLEWLFEKANRGHQTIDLLKLDCEGAEYDILANASQGLLERVQCIVGEYHGDGGFERFEKALKSRLPDFEVSPVGIQRPSIGEFCARRVRPKSTRVLFVCPHLSTGGMPEYVLNATKALLTMGCEVQVIEYTNIASTFTVQRRQIAALVKLHTLEDPGKPEKMMAIIEAFQPDVVHLQELPETWLYSDSWVQAANLLFAKPRPYKIVATPHSAKAKPSSDPRYEPDAYSLVSWWQAIEFRRNSATPAYLAEYRIAPHTRPPRIQALAQLQLDPKKRHILNVGLWTPEKNQGKAIEVARLMPDFNFHFVGNQAENFKNYWGPIMQNFPQNCTVWGERSDVDLWYASMDAFLFTSLNELSPMCIKEALAWGMPVFMKKLPTYLNEYDQVPNVTFIDDNEEAIAAALRAMFPSLGHELLHIYKA